MSTLISVASETEEARVYRVVPLSATGGPLHRKLSPRPMLGPGHSRASIADVSGVPSEALPLNVVPGVATAIVAGPSGPTFVTTTATAQASVTPRPRNATPQTPASWSGGAAVPQECKVHVVSLGGNPPVGCVGGQYWDASSTKASLAPSLTTDSYARVDSFRASDSHAASCQGQSRSSTPVPVHSVPHLASASLGPSSWQTAQLVAALGAPVTPLPHPQIRGSRSVSPRLRTVAGEFAVH